LTIRQLARDYQKIGPEREIIWGCYKTRWYASKINGHLCMHWDGNTKCNWKEFKNMRWNGRMPDGWR
jgi:hypothetical protein